MPIFSDEDLDKAIDAGEIGAITLDTNIMEKFGFDFDHPMLRNLTQFSELHLKVIFSDIVVREVQSHIDRNAEKSFADLRRALGNYKRTWELSGTRDELVLPHKPQGSATAFARTKWEKFVKKIDGHDVKAEDALPVQTLIDDYFSANPPFKREGEKKSEFPDSIALLSLQEWSRKRKTKVLAISNDDGWVDFAKLSKHIIVVRDIAKVFDHYNRSAHFIAQNISRLVEFGCLPSLDAEVREIIRAHFDDSSMEIEADSSLQFETEFEGVDILEMAHAPAFSVVSADAEAIEIALQYLCKLRFKAVFSWYIWDSVDRESIPAGSDVITVEEENVLVEVVAKFPREFTDVPKYSDLEASILPEIPNYGTVEPAWRREPED